MSSQLDAQYELCRSAERKTRRVEAELLDNEQRLRQLDLGVTASDNAAVLRQHTLNISLFACLIVV